MYFLVVISGLLLALAESPVAEAAPEANLAGEVSELMRRLDAVELRTRDEAERKLEGMGPQALPHLPADDKKLSAEAAGRLKRVRQKLLRAQAIAAAESSHVTLRGEALPLEAVLAEFSKQSGNPIKDHRTAFGQLAEERQVTVAFDKTPFWHALDAVLDQAELTLYGYSGESGLFLVNRRPGATPRAANACYSGAFRLEPRRFEALRDLAEPEQGSLRLVMEVSWEPRLQPFALLQPLDTMVAETDLGPAEATNPNAEAETIVRQGTSAAEFDILFQLPPREATKLAKLSGKISAIVPGPLEEFRFAEVPIADGGKRPASIAQTQGGTTVTLDSLRPNEDLWEMNLRIRFEAPSAALESHRGWMLNNEAAFVDADGQELRHLGIEQTLQGEEIGLKYLFELPDGPEKLEFVYRTPLIVLEVEVPYEFKNLPLP